MRITSKFIVLIGLIFVGMFAARAAHAYDLSAYLPVLDGNSMPYDQTIDGGAAPQTVISTGSAVSVNGITTHPVTTSANSVDLVQVQYAAWGSNGLQIHQEEEKARTAANLQTFIGSFSSPAGSYRLLLPVTLLQGGAVSYTGITEDVKDASNQTVYKKNISCNITLAGTQNVTVPAGTFNNCLKMTITENITVTDSSGANTIRTEANNITLYLAYLVGVVQKTVDYTEVAAGTTTHKIIEEKLSSHVDSDGDGLTDTYETLIGTNPNSVDSDRDGLRDGLELIVYGTDPLSNIDSDGDGMSNDWEYVYGLNPNTNDALQDMDQDGVTNVAELVYGTDPSNNDTDNDGVSDNYEITLIDIGYANADPTNPNLIPDQAAMDVYNSLKSCSRLHVRNTRTNTEYPSLQDAYNAAASGDTLQTHAVSFYEDLNLNRDISITLQGGYDCSYTTNPATTALRTKNGAVNIILGTVTAGNMVVQTDYDNDSDGMPTSWEVFSDLNPMVDDSRADADLDRLNNIGEYLAGTDPLVRKDTDGDRMMDDWEKAKGINPGVADGGGDKDSDGLTNLQEFLAGTDPNLTDTDGDGVSDTNEAALQKVGYPNADPTDPNMTPNMSLPDVQAALNVYNSFNNCTHFPVRIVGGREYHSVQAAYAAANTGDTIQIHAKGFFENFAATLDISVNIQGGFDCGYTTNPVYTTMKTTGGAVNITLGTVTMGNLIIEDAPDTDGDGMPDEWEMAYGLNPVDPADAHQDTDADGLDNLSEFLLGTDPTNRDTDGDGCLDQYDTDPLDPNVMMTVANGDINQDGVVDAGDVMLAQRISLGLITPTAAQIAHGDVAPVGAPDGVINGADVLVIQRKALGLQ